MKQGKKIFLVLLLTAMIVGIFPVSAQAVDREYMIRVSAGNKGSIPGYDNAPYTVFVPYGTSVTLSKAEPKKGYYVKGIKESGKDTIHSINIEAPSFDYYVTQDQDIIFVYGVEGAEVSYVVRYLEYGTDKVLAPEQTFYADPGDKVVSSHIYIEGYERSFRTTKTLVKWDPTDPNPNVLFAYYTKIPAETTAAAGGGGGAAAAGGGAAAGGNANAGNANANAGNANANAGNANADNNVDNTGGEAAAENAAVAQQAQQPAQQSYAQVEDILDLDVPLASFDDIVGSTGSSGSSEPSITSSPAVIEENTKPKGMSKGLLIFFIVLFFCLVGLLYWYLLFYRKKKKYADVEVVTFADDDEEDDDFDIEEFRRRHRKKDE